MVGWVDIAFQMPPEIKGDVAAAWSWIIPNPWEPILCSKLGGIFMRYPDGEVHWLEAPIALVERVAGSADEFHEICRAQDDRVNDWFAPGLVEQLHGAGKIAGSGQCYGFTFLPIFAEGKYAPDNMFVTSIRESLVGVADIHKQIAELPDGSKVQFKIVE